MGHPLLLFDISSGELVIIILAIMVIFGPKQIPIIARSIGKVLYEVRKASDQIKKEVMEETKIVKDIINPEQILKNNISGEQEFTNKAPNKTEDRPLNENEQSGEPNKSTEA